MDANRKAMLLETKAQLETEVVMYRRLLCKAEAMVHNIDSELADSFKPGNSNYSSGELAAVRRDILSIVGESWVAPREILDRLHEHCSDLVTRELHKLAANDRCDVMWNQRRGPASMYRRFRAVV